MNDLPGKTDHRLARFLSQAIVGLCGAGILAFAAHAGPEWMDRHFLPDFFKPAEHRVAVANVVRIVLALAGIALLVVVRPRVARLAGREGGGAVLWATVRVGGAVVLSLLVCEGVLSTGAWRSRHEGPKDREPVQQDDPRLGWTLVSNHVGTRDFEGRTVEYALDASGYRVRCPACATDFDRESLLFAGESIMLGTGIDWPDTTPALVEAATGLQGVNLAVNGYATDQVYGRLALELPRFHRVAALVVLFMPSLLPRNLEHDRPYLDASLQWHPARRPWRLEALFDRMVRYAGTDRIDEGLRMTRAALVATGDLARSRGARLLVLEPRYPPKSPAEAAQEDTLRHRVLDGSGLEVVPIALDESWRLGIDEHPDARADRAMADAVVAWLGGEQRP